MKHLNGDDAAEQQILGTVDNGHTTAANTTKELITSIENSGFTVHQPILDRF